MIHEFQTRSEAQAAGWMFCGLRNIRYRGHYVLMSYSIGRHLMTIRLLEGDHHTPEPSKMEVEWRVRPQQSISFRHRNVPEDAQPLPAILKIADERDRPTGRMGRLVGATHRVELARSIWIARSIINGTLDRRAIRRRDPDFEVTE